MADTHIALVNEQTEASAYLAAVAQQRAVAKAYLQSPNRRRHRGRPRRPPVTAPGVGAGVGRSAGRPCGQCESDGNYGDDTGNGYYGAYQFTLGTWRSLGLGGLPSQASPAEQDQAAQQLQARRGWGQWPSCSRRLGLT